MASDQLPVASEPGRTKLSDGGLEAVKIAGMFTLLAISLLISAPSLFGTTCVAGKKFKVRQVCGVVTDKWGAAVPGTAIQVAPENSPDNAKEGVSDENGRFMVADLPDGEYILQAKSRYFWHAWQPFTLRHSHDSRTCKHTIHVVMVPAGGCSYVENAWKKSDLKK